MMKSDAEHSDKIKDIQALPDVRHVALDEVGISELRMPIHVHACERDAGKTQAVQATVAMAVNLDAEHKGIHMSRLIESFLACEEHFSLQTLGTLLHNIRDRQKADRAKVEVAFDYFLTRHAPETQKAAPQAYRCVYRGELIGEQLTRQQTITIPVTTLCPCSKEISDYGAHNQRGDLQITTFHDGTGDIGLCLEEIVDIAETCASAPLFPILKREDERHVTMRAYENPCFVEDVARNVAVQLNEDTRFDRYGMQIINYESIHTHNAYAIIQPRPAK